MNPNHFSDNELTVQKYELTKEDCLDFFVDKTKPVVKTGFLILPKGNARVMSKDGQNVLIFKENSFVYAADNQIFYSSYVVDTDDDLAIMFCFSKKNGRKIEKTFHNLRQNCDFLVEDKYLFVISGDVRSNDTILDQYSVSLLKDSTVTAMSHASILTIK